MELADLIESRDAAIAEDEEAERDQTANALALELSRARHVRTSEARAAAQKAIADLVREKGQHYLIDADNGTVTSYDPCDEEPGYIVGHPIPGKIKAAK